MTFKRDRCCGARGVGNRERLALHLQAALTKPFVWGKSDCVTFANDAVMAQRGVGFVDDILARPYSGEFGAMRMWRRAQEATGHHDIVELLDDRLTRSGSRHPVMGSVVARPVAARMVFTHAIGIMGGRGCHFMTATGLMCSDLGDGDLTWEI